MTAVFLSDVRDNLSVVATMDGLDGLVYRRRVEFYRRVAAEIGCLSDVERVIATVEAEATAAISL